MYTPKAFKISEQEALEFIQHNAFGQTGFNRTRSRNAK